jgi:FKBP-type peptidyl-prolyl cis-trans isomerase
MGYGKFSQPGIPGGSTLIFEIELLGNSMMELFDV